MKEERAALFTELHSNEDGSAVTVTRPASASAPATNTEVIKNIGFQVQKQLARPQSAPVKSAGALLFSKKKNPPSTNTTVPVHSKLISSASVTQIEQHSNLVPQVALQLQFAEKNNPKDQQQKMADINLNAGVGGKKAQQQQRPASASLARETVHRAGSYVRPSSAASIRATSSFSLSSSASVSSAFSSSSIAEEPFYQSFSHPSRPSSATSVMSTESTTGISDTARSGRTQTSLVFESPSNKERVTEGGGLVNMQFLQSGMQRFQDYEEDSDEDQKKEKIGQKTTSFSPKKGAFSPKKGALSPKKEKKKKSLRNKRYTRRKTADAYGTHGTSGDSYSNGYGIAEEEEDEGDDVGWETNEEYVRVDLPDAKELLVDYENSEPLPDPAVQQGKENTESPRPDKKFWYPTQPSLKLFYESFHPHSRAQSNSQSDSHSPSHSNPHSHVTQHKTLPSSESRLGSVQTVQTVGTELSLPLSPSLHSLAPPLLVTHFDDLTPSSDKSPTNMSVTQTMASSVAFISPSRFGYFTSHARDPDRQHRAKIVKTLKTRHLAMDFSSRSAAMHRNVPEVTQAYHIQDLTGDDHHSSMAAWTQDGGNSDNVSKRLPITHDIQLGLEDDHAHKVEEFHKKSHVKRMTYSIALQLQNEPRAFAPDSGTMATVQRLLIAKQSQAASAKQVQITYNQTHPNSKQGVPNHITARSVTDKSALSPPSQPSIQPPREMPEELGVVNVANTKERKIASTHSKMGSKLSRSSSKFKLSRSSSNLNLKNSKKTAANVNAIARPSSAASEPSKCASPRLSHTFKDGTNAHSASLPEVAAADSVPVPAPVSVLVSAPASPLSKAFSFENNYAGVGVGVGDLMGGDLSGGVEAGVGTFGRDSGSESRNVGGNGYNGDNVDMTGEGKEEVEGKDGKGNGTDGGRDGRGYQEGDGESIGETELHAIADTELQADDMENGEHTKEEDIQGQGNQNEQDDDDGDGDDNVHGDDGVGRQGTHENKEQELKEEKEERETNEEREEKEENEEREETEEKEEKDIEDAGEETVSEQEQGREGGGEAEGKAEGIEGEAASEEEREEREERGQQNKGEENERENEGETQERGEGDEEEVAEEAEGEAAEETEEVAEETEEEYQDEQTEEIEKTAKETEDVTEQEPETEQNEEGEQEADAERDDKEHSEHTEENQQEQEEEHEDDMQKQTTDSNERGSEQQHLEEQDQEQLQEQEHEQQQEQEQEQEHGQEQQAQQETKQTQTQDQEKEKKQTDQKVKTEGDEKHAGGEKEKGSKAAGGAVVVNGTEVEGGEGCSNAEASDNFLSSEDSEAKDFQGKGKGSSNKEEKSRGSSKFNANEIRVLNFSQFATPSPGQKNRHKQSDSTSSIQAWAMTSQSPRLNLSMDGPQEYHAAPMTNFDFDVDKPQLNDNKSHDKTSRSQSTLHGSGDQRRASSAKLHRSSLGSAYKSNFPNEQRPASAALISGLRNKNSKAYRPTNTVSPSSERSSKSSSPKGPHVNVIDFSFASTGRRPRSSGFSDVTPTSAARSAGSARSAHSQNKNSVSVRESNIATLFSPLDADRWLSSDVTQRPASAPRTLSHSNSTPGVRSATPAPARTLQIGFPSRGTSPAGPGMRRATSKTELFTPGAHDQHAKLMMTNSVITSGRLATKPRKVPKQVPTDSPVGAAKTKMASGVKQKVAVGHAIMAATESQPPSASSIAGRLRTGLALSSMPGPSLNLLPSALSKKPIKLGGSFW